MSFERKLAEYRGRIEEALECALRELAAPEPLPAAMRYSLLAGGKRLRPCLTLAACELAGGEIESALPLCVGIEMIHTYSLIHDDLPCMDDDDYRRGKPSSHKRFGENTAILAGDALLTYAFEWMLGAALRAPGNLGYWQAIHLIARCAGPKGMVAGQVEDLNSKAQRNSARLEQIHSLKTGALLRAAVLAGAMAASPQKTMLDALDQWALFYGKLFQITDDILDAKGDFARLGKTPGKDQRGDKLTYVTLFGVQGAQERAKIAARDALSALAAMDADTAFFEELTQNTLIRQS